MPAKGRYKLVALDMDGTVLNDAGEISEVNRKWLTEAMRNDVAVVFATGRGMVRIQPYMEELGMDGPVITTNGGEVWQRPGSLYSRRVLDAAVMKRICKFALEEDLHYWAYASEGLFKRDSWIPEDQIDQMKWLKFGIRVKDQEHASRIRQQLASWEEIEITSSHPCQIEINARHVNKGAGVREVCSMLGIRMSQVVAIGDGDNDISMITSAGLGVAMGNATDEVKRYADLIAPPNEEHGVARIIQEYVI